jgi:hypothetical protein
MNPCPSHNDVSILSCAICSFLSSHPRKYCCVSATPDKSQLERKGEEVRWMMWRYSDTGHTSALFQTVALSALCYVCVTQPTDGHKVTINHQLGTLKLLVDSAVKSSPSKRV